MAVLELSAVDRALDRVAEGRAPSAAEATALLDTPASRLPDLLGAAAALRDRGRGRRITFSAKVFIPLTTLCRDYCGYCTFRKDPGEPGAFTMTPEQVLALAQAGARLGAKEALFSLGDKPEALFPEHRAFLRRMGHRTTLGYLRAVSERVLEETGLLPHANPGLMTERDLAALREVNVSMGIMLESTSARLLAPGRGPRSRARQGARPTTQDHRPRRRARHSLHHRDPDRHRGDPRRAGRRPPGHPRPPRAPRPHPGGHRPELPRQADHSHARLARARRGGSASHGGGGPPAAGTDDEHPGAAESVRRRTTSASPPPASTTGAASRPLTPDHINPERPWPGLAELRRRTESAGHELRERLAIYPEYATRSAFLDPRLSQRVARLVDPEGFVRPDLEVWRHW